MNQFLRRLKRRTGVALHISYPWVALYLVLAAITGWAAAETIFDAPGAGQRTISVISFCVLLSVFLAVHELGHLWQSARSGARSQQFTFYPTGITPSGYTISESPGGEIRDALAGPIASALFAAPLLALLLVVPEESSVGRLILWSGGVNLLIAGVNLLPAMPLDGGRIHRAIFWFLHDDHPSGTRVTYLYSQLIAAGVLGMGLFILAFRVDLLIPGIWATVLAWMIMRASRFELVRSTLISRAGTVRAADGVIGLNPTIRAAATIAEAVDILLEQHSNGPGLVRDRDKFVGTLTLQMVRDIPRSRWDELTVRETMRPVDSMVSSNPGDCLLDVLRLQQECDDDTVIVREAGGDIAGLINSDISPRTLLRRAEERSFEMLVPDATHEQPPRS